MFTKILVLISLINLGLSQTESPYPLQILKKEMETSMERHAYSVVLDELADESKDNKIHSTSISSKMNERFGRGWVCSVGSNETGINFEEHEPNHYIHFKFDEIEVVLFKIKRETAIDMIKVARNNTNSKKIEINTIKDTTTKTTITTIVDIAIKNLNDFKSIALNITNEMKTKTGYNWVAVCETREGGISINTEIVETIIITIQEIHIIVYKETAKSCSDNFNALINEARSAQPVITWNIANNTILKQITDIVKSELSYNVTLSECKDRFSNSSNNCNYYYTSKIRTALSSKFGGNWFVTMGDIDTFSVDYEPTTSIVSGFNLGRLRFYVVH